MYNYVCAKKATNLYCFSRRCLDNSFLPSAGHQGHISDIQNIGAHGHYLWLTWPPETAYKQNKEQITGGMQLFYCGCSNSWHMHVPFSDDRQHKTRLSSNTMHKLVFSQTNYAKKASRNNMNSNLSPVRSLQIVNCTFSVCQPCSQGRPSCPCF